MSRPNQVQQTILELVGELEVVRRQTLHLLPHHRVTINNAIRDMLASGLIAEKQKGQNKHYILTLSGKKRLREQSWIYEEHMFLPSKIRSDSWERLILAGDIMTMLHISGFNVYRANRPYLNDFDRYPDLWAEQYLNTFIPAMELKQYLGGNLPSLQYSRICGLLFTPMMPYRVYHTRNVAMEVRLSGENNVNGLADRKIFSKTDGKKAGALIFGDRDMVSLEKIISNTLDTNNMSNKLRAIGKHKKKSHQITELLSAGALGYHTSYLPLNREALPLLRLYQYSDGLAQAEMGIRRYLTKGSEYDEYGAKIFGVGRDYYLYVCDLQIKAICSHLKNLKQYLAHGTVTIICIEWQLEVWQRIIERHFPQYSIRFQTIYNTYVEHVCNWCQERDDGLIQNADKDISE